MKSSTGFNNARATRSDIGMIHRAGDVGHFVHFYKDDRFALENIGRLASWRMAAGDSGVFVATRPHLEVIEKELLASGVELDGKAITLRPTRTRAWRDSWETDRRRGDKFLDLCRRHRQPGNRTKS